jgi:hypothetical protein
MEEVNYQQESDSKMLLKIVGLLLVKKSKTTDFKKMDKINEDNNEAYEVKSNKSENTKSSSKILNPPLKFIKMLKTASSFWSNKFCFK